MNINKKIILLVSFVLVLLFAGLIVLRIFQPVKSLKQAHPDYTLTSNELFKQFNLNEEKANIKYVGKIIRVRGIISEIINNQDQTIILLKTNDNFASISCKLENSEKNAHNLKPEQQIVIKGECSGKLIDVMLINCVLCK